MRKALFLIIVVSIFIYIFPIISQFSDSSTIELYSNKDDFGSATLRSFLFALGATLFIIPISFFLSLYLNNLGKNLGIDILLVPFTIGSIGVSFIFKFLLFDTIILKYIINSTIIVQFFSLLALQFWHLGTLFILLFWFNLRNIPSYQKEYFLASKISFKYHLKDLYLPQSKNLIILLSILCFSISLYEDSKTQLIFKASRGMKNELINHWLYRTYQSNLLVELNHARSILFSHSTIIMVLCLFVLVGIVISLIAFLKKLEGFKSLLNIRIFDYLSSFRTGKVLLLCCISLIVVPIILVLMKFKFESKLNVTPLVSSFLLTFFTTMFSLIVIILIAFYLKVIFRKYMTGFNLFTSALVVMLFSVLFFAPISILVNNFYWFGLIGISLSKVYLIWTFSHLILIFPIIGSFIILIYFSVSNEEIEYIKIHRIGNYRLFIWSFLKRYPAEFILSFLISFSMIWNDKTVNILVADWIPSFSQKLEMAMIGRGSDYEIAFLYFLVALVISSLIVILWSKIRNRILTK